MKMNNIKMSRQIEVLYEDNHIIAVNKSVSDIVQPDPSGDKSLEEIIKDYIKEKYNKPGDVFLGVVHRIDRPVSGVVMFARTSKALTRINEMFQTSKISKHYRAIVKNHPPADSGTLKNYITRNTKINKSFISEEMQQGYKLAELDYKLIGKSDKYYLLDINLKTGRHHQIRVQLAHAGCPIKGDLKYGFPRSNEDGGISLHSYMLQFVHPIKKETITIKAPFPEDKLWNAFKGL